MRCGLVALVVFVSGVGMGCDGDDSPPAPAHSSSFFPVRGTADGGGPAGELQWVYRVNGGAVTPLVSSPPLTVRSADEVIRISETTMTSVLKGTLGSSDPATRISGTTSWQSTDHLSSDSPARILAREVNSNGTATAEGMSLSTRAMYRYAFATTPQPIFFDRTDLDTLAPGYSETATIQATVDATATVTDSAGTRTASETQSLMMELSWTLDAGLATFQVLGKDYANVVQVHQVNTSTDLTSGTTATAMTTAWLAKGIGFIRTETTLTGPSEVQDDLLELVSTNLVGP